ncbi:BTB POZ and TAZ domain-containing 1-like isoform X1 [Chlorella sorokiniana]|uniref:BTB POZ and TAZ domain-containing 1-like isoform X1 n=1 Tax=Chlorella sorokiniana TaxID=3076 RepID=A0A2P6TKD3_CHLSO|nr:BTB POZ and TAZ domain-containing 1-like isoform X1 [Chlorella sorokiniana]|eukprot:PRW44536.1 BTB POZ and TAZ domain-containing 1-like isoform X1 [Chlorella sorokiniana]
MAPFTTEMDWADPAAFYLGDGSLADVADVAIVHRASGLRLPAHSHILAQQSRVMRDLFLSLRGQTSGRKRKADEEEGAAMELESPFNDYSLQEVSFLLRLVYRPSDLTDRNLESVLEHLPGITRLANSLNAASQLASVDKFLAVKAAHSYSGAVKWTQLAEQCGLDNTWAAGVRALASKFLKLPAGAPPAYRCATGLIGLSHETVIAVLAAVAAAVNRIDSPSLNTAVSSIPDAAIKVAGRSEAALGSASLVWEVPQLASLLGKRESPAIGPASLGATFQDECPPGVALAAALTVQLIGQTNAVVSTRRQSHTLSKSNPTMGWSWFMDTNGMAARLSSAAGKGTFKVQVEWLELQPSADEE